MANAYQTLILAEPSLIHFYGMQETSGNQCQDLQAGHSGTYNGSPGFLAANLAQSGLPTGGYSVQFLGAGTGSTGVTIGTFSTGGSGETLEAWVFLAALPPVQSVVATHSIKSGGQYSTLIEINPDGTVRWYIAATTGGAHDTTTVGALSLNRWHHLVICAPTNGTAYLYVDGVASAGIPIGTVNGIASALYLDIGNYDDGSAVATYKICNVAIYNSGLSAAAVLSHYNAGIGTQTPTVSYILTGPNGGRVGKAAGPFYVVPSGVTTDTINLAAVGGIGGTFTPAALTLTNSGNRVPFYFTAPAVGSTAITVQPGSGATVSGSPKAFHATATSRHRGLKWFPMRDRG